MEWARYYVPQCIQQQTDDVRKYFLVICNVSKIDIFKISYFPMLRFIVVTLKLSKSQWWWIEKHLIKISEWQGNVWSDPCYETCFVAWVPILLCSPDQAVAPVAGHAPRETGAWCTARGARQRVIRPGTRPTRPASLLMRVCTPDSFTWHSLSSPQSFQHISHLRVEIWELLLITSNDF